MIAVTNALGCPTLLGTSQIECVSQTGCVATFRPLTTTGKPGISGSATLVRDARGITGFSGATLTLGSVMRTGCSGQWDPATGTMGIDCGGMGTPQSCVIVLHFAGMCQ